MFAALHRYDLAELYLKLKNCEKAEKVVKTALEQEKGEWIIFTVPLRAQFLESRFKFNQWLGETFN